MPKINFFNNDISEVKNISNNIELISQLLEERIYYNDELSLRKMHREIIDDSNFVKLVELYNSFLSHNKKAPLLNNNNRLPGLTFEEIGKNSNFYSFLNYFIEENKNFGSNENEDADSFKSYLHKVKVILNSIQDCFLDLVKAYNSYRLC